jgi:hypothetical protein
LLFSAKVIIPHYPEYNAGHAVTELFSIDVFDLNRISLRHFPDGPDRAKVDA